MTTAPQHAPEEALDTPAPPAEEAVSVPETGEPVSPEGAQAPAEAPASETPPEDSQPTEKQPTLVEKVQAFRTRYAMWEVAGFFFAGFLYDILTLSRIDDRRTLLQQGVYLGVLGTLLLLEQRWGGEVAPPRWMEKAWRFREDALHFLLGNLLSAYTLFYFKSASGVTALLFLGGLLALLVGNELPRFRALGPVVRVGLYSFCLTSYFAYLLPVLLGFLSEWLFFVAVGVGSAGVWGLFHLVRRWSGGDTQGALRRVAVTGWGMQGLLLGLYLLKVIPPVPLAVEFSGIYHEVEKRQGPQGREYLLHHEREDWKFWQKGDQDFRVRPDDKAWYFVRIFAPASFEDRVTFRWYYDDPREGWKQHGAFTTSIVGGRERGFRTMAYTANPRPGKWRVAVETEDGREIGRMSFTVRADERTAPREFKVDKDA